MIVGAQLGREKDRKNKVRLDNLREAGDLEQDANIVLGIYNPYVDAIQARENPENAMNSDLMVTVLKQRNGPVNKDIKLHLNAPAFKISD